MKNKAILRSCKIRRLKTIVIIFIAVLLALGAAPLKNSDLEKKFTASGELTDKRDYDDEFGLASRSLENSRERAGVNQLDVHAGVKGSIVVIDAGHGGNDCGTGYNDLEEKDINLDIALKLGELLKTTGISIIYTREKDEYIGLNKRAAIANNADADLFISIHCNGMENDSTCNGSETLYKNKKSEQGKVNSEKFAEIIQSELSGAISTKDNGVISRPRLAVLALTKMPAVIAEVGYISNPDDREKLDSDHYRQKAAAALYNGVIKTLNEMK